MTDKNEVREGRSFEDARTGRRGIITDQGHTGALAGLYDDNVAEEKPLPPLEHLIILPPGTRRAKPQNSE